MNVQELISALSQMPKESEVFFESYDNTLHDIGWARKEDGDSGDVIVILD